SGSTRLYGLLVPFLRQGSVYSGFAKLCLMHNLGHCYSGLPQRLNLSNLLDGKFQLTAKMNPSLLSFGDAIHLPFPADVVLKLGYQRQDTHNKLPCACGGVDRWIIYHPKGHALLGELRDDAIEVCG